MQKVVVLCDFDGTVAEKDVGDLLFRRFGGPSAQDAAEEWVRGEINSRECLERQAAATSCSADELRSFAHACRLDPYFRDFHDFARRRGIEVVVLSDGLDFYIEQILARQGCGSLEFYANRLRIEGGALRVEFPWYNLRDCTECGCCKTHHLFRYRHQGYFVVYVGNGLSDRCPSENADLVFAKGELLDHCRARHIDCVEFRNFRDVEREVLRRILLDSL
jgi:2-hydroxy-3-keto-5-methylthiopentenyl-1-phosphate phosphatase